MKKIDTTTNISKVYKEISTILCTARANANLVKALIKVIFVI